MVNTTVVRYNELTRWDVKSYMYLLQSNYPVKKLSQYLIENTTKVKPFQYPDDNFDILGVKNTVGIYLNVTLKVCWSIIFVPPTTEI